MITPETAAVIQEHVMLIELWGIRKSLILDSRL
jgi:hypothetical protein